MVVWSVIGSTACSLGTARVWNALCKSKKSQVGAGPWFLPCYVVNLMLLQWFHGPPGHVKLSCQKSPSLRSFRFRSVFWSLSFCRPCSGTRRTHASWKIMALRAWFWWCDDAEETLTCCWWHDPKNIKELDCSSATMPPLFQKWKTPAMRLPSNQLALRVFLFLGEGY